MSKSRALVFPRDLEVLRARAMRAISPIKPGESKRGRELDYWVNARRTGAGRRLPAYYLVYFLLVDLLHFEDLGQFEKEAWTVPIDFNGQIFTITHAKSGVGVFAPNPQDHEDDAKRIVDLISRGVRVAESYFEWRAATAVQASQLNVVNHSGWLLQRYRFLREQFDNAVAEAEGRKHDRIVTTSDLPGGRIITSSESPYWGLKQNVKWLGLAAIEAFFSWTEHVFIHLAILQGKVTSGDRVAELAEADWQEKFKAALDVTDRQTKAHFDKLVVIRRQIRNFVSHGAFGKQGQAFRFHSRVGAVPVLLSRRPGKGRFSLASEPEVEEGAALQALDEFFDHLWSGARAPGRIYLIEDITIPTILPMASDGTYAAAMQSVEDMKSFVDGLAIAFDNAANMDW